MAGSSEDATERRTRVFISYSRKDGVFAEGLRDALNARDFEAYLDKHDIAPGEPWRERLSGLITSADTVVFCLSESFVASQVCDWEVYEAERLGKRLLPVVAADTSQDNVPQRLKRLNYIFMQGEGEERPGLEKLVTALNIEIAWIREHTRLGERAHEWRASGHSEGMLLRGEHIVAAEAWLTGRPREAPEVTEAIANFVAESRKAETARQWRARRRGQSVAAISLTATAIMGFLGWQMYGQWQAAQIRQSLNLANHANQQVARGDTVVGTLLALEALPEPGATAFLDRLRPLVPDARASLYRAIHAGAGRWSLSGHDKSLTAVRLSPDGALFATASKDGTARIWDVATGRQHAVLVGHQGQIRALEFSPDGRLLATGATDQTVRLWDWRAGRPLSTMVGHRAQVSRLAFDVNGTHLLSVADDHAVHVWAVATGELVMAPTDKSSTGLPVKFDRVTFLPEGSLLTVGGVGETVARVWDVASGASREIFKHAHDGNLRIDMSPDGKRVAAITQKRMLVFDVTTGAVLGRFDAPDASKFWRTQFSADGSRLAVHVDFGNQTQSRWRVDIVDARSGAFLCSTPMQERIAPRFEFDTKGRRLFAYMGLLVGTTFYPDAVWDGSTCTPSAQLVSHRRGVWDVFGRDYTVAPDGTRLISWSYDTVEIWDVSTGREIVAHRVQGRQHGWYNFALHPSGRIIVGFDGTNLDVFNARSGQHLHRLDGHSDEVSAPLFAAHGNRLITHTDNAVTIWNTDNWMRLGPPLADERVIHSVDLSGDRQYVLVQYKAASDDVTAVDFFGIAKIARFGRVVAVEDGREIMLRKGDEAHHWAQLNSPDGRHDYRVEPGKNSEIFDVVTGQTVATLSDHMGMVQLSANRRRLVTVRDTSAWVWEFPSGKLVSRLTGNSLGVGLNVAINHDGRRVITAPDFAGGGAEGTTLGPDGRPIAAAADKAKGLRLWNAETGKLIAPLEGHTDRIEFQAMSPDGRRLITLSNDKTARIWSLETGQLEAVLDLGDVSVTSGAAFGPEGQYVLTWTQSDIPGTALTKLPDGRYVSTPTPSETAIWYLSPTTETLVQRARGSAPRCLIEDERRAFFLPLTPPRWCYEMKKWPYHDHTKTPPPPYSLDELLLAGWDAMGGDAVLGILSRTIDWIRNSPARLLPAPP